MAFRTLCGAALLVCLGCSGGGNTLSLDHNVARESLKTALEAWKSGDTPEGLKARSPSIIMGDFAWREGKRLIRYTVRDQEMDDGTNLHCKVDLVLAGDGGRESSQAVTYIVGTSPVITIFRD